MKNLTTTILIAALVFAVAADLHAKRKSDKTAIVKLQTIPGGCSLFVSGTAVEKTTESGKWLEIQCPEGRQHLAVKGDSTIISFELTATNSKTIFAVANLVAGTVYAGTSKDSIDTVHCEVIRDIPDEPSDIPSSGSTSITGANTHKPGATGNADSALVGEFVPVEIQPEMISESNPNYPRQAKEAGIKGTVWVMALIDKEGTVRFSKVARSSRSTLLDAAAVNAAYGCKYKPGMQKHRPVACWVTYKVEFKLQ